ncbi:MAG: choline dehydrogenase-like flavoprotein [Planctomycetota bacterium]
MKADILIIGSGASGVHFARRALEAGRIVHMIDVGIGKPPAVLPSANFHELKAQHENAHDYFLGANNESMILPDHGDEFYGFPPSKEFVFSDPLPQETKSRGFSPLFSYAQGGLAEAWTGGSYPFNNQELADYPFDFQDLAPYYEDVARNIGISGADDDLSSLYPFHDGIESPVDLDAHGSHLLATYQRKKSKFAKESFVMGRARLAVLSQDRGERKACQKLDRCLWGCPIGSLYVPSWTLKNLMAHERFHYQSGLKVSHFKTKGSGVSSVVAIDIASGQERNFDCENLVMAAGTLASARIFLASIAEDGSEAPELTGLMDNRQMLMPFVNLSLLGKKWDVDNYQYHQLAMGLDLGGPMDFVHGLVTTLKSALIHPVIQNLPFSLGTSARFFREMHTALGLVNINFSDLPRSSNRVGLEKTGEGDRLMIHYEPDAAEAARIKRVAKIFRRALRRLGCFAPKGMSHIRPMGASVHYAGTLPMKDQGGDWTLDATGRSRCFKNLWFVDGTGLPALPAKNLTFTLMANAARIAEVSFA